MIDLTEVVVSIIGLAISVITCVVVPYIKKKLNSETYSQVQFWATVGVEAAEMIYNQSGKGAEKKAYVLQFLRSKGFNLDEDSLDKVVEAAVLELKQAFAD